MAASVGSNIKTSLNANCDKYSIGIYYESKRISIRIKKTK